MPNYPAKIILTQKVNSILGLSLILLVAVVVSASIFYTASAQHSLTSPHHTIEPRGPAPKLEKLITISLKDQTLAYSEGAFVLGLVKISSGLKYTPTPPGEYSVLKKKSVVHYRGADYNFPNTKWNLMFKPGKSGNYYIHGAYWHKNFGNPMSHGCVNVAYADMEALYNWADEGTKIFIE